MVGILKRKRNIYKDGIKIRNCKKIMRRNNSKIYKTRKKITRKIDEIINYKKNKKVAEEQRELLQERFNPIKISEKEKFNNILDIAKKILENTDDIKDGRNPIFDYIRLIGRGIESDYMKFAIYYNCEGGEHNVQSPSGSELLINENKFLVKGDGKEIRIGDLKKEKNLNVKIDLSKTMVLTCPWNRNRMINNIKKIGREREWQYDNNNHSVNIWLPMGLVWVNNGNHSIMMGILQGGEIKPEIYYDISEMYKYIKCDGENFIRIKEDIFNGQIINSVKNIELAAIFEIGRMLDERGISFLK